MALVLGREPGEAVVIGENIRVQLVRHSSGSLHLAITAPRDVRIMREELLTDSKSPGPQNDEDSNDNGNGKEHD